MCVETFVDPMQLYVNVHTSESPAAALLLLLF
jgi:hypothetical protein